MEIEPITQKQVDALQRAIGLGAMIIDFHDVDLSAGRGNLGGNDKCLWTKKGYRITINFRSCPEGPVLMASQSKDPDPDYPNKDME